MAVRVIAHHGGDCQEQSRLPTCGTLAREARRRAVTADRRQPGFMDILVIEDDPLMPKRFALLGRSPPIAFGFCRPANRLRTSYTAVRSITLTGLSSM